MRRAIASGTAAALLTMGWPAPATSAVVIVDGDHFAGSGMSLRSQSCVDPAVPVPTAPRADLLSTPGPAPLGKRFLGLDSAGVGFAIGPVVQVARPTSVSAFSVSVRSPNALATAIAVVEYAEPNRPGIWKGFVRLPDDPIAGWHTATVPGTTLFQWRHYDQPGHLDAASGTATTIRDFVNDHGGDAPGASIGILYGCDGDPFFLDALQVTSADGTTSFDFEGYQTRLAINPAVTERSVTVTAGERVPLRAMLRSAFDGSPLTGKVQFDGRPLSGSTYQRLSTESAGRDGKLEMFVQPQRSAVYRMEFPGSGLYDASADVFTVRVRSNVTAKLRQRQIRTGQKFTITGRVAPARRAKATLEAFVLDRWRPVKKFSTSGKGLYSVSMTSREAGKTFWRVRVDDGGGNLSGSSVWLRLTTIEPPKPHHGGHHGGGHSGGGGGGHSSGGGTPDPTPPPPVQPPPPPPPPGPLRPGTLG